MDLLHTLSSIDGLANYDAKTNADTRDALDMLSECDPGGPDYGVSHSDDNGSILLFLSEDPHNNDQHIVLTPKP